MAKIKPERNTSINSSIEQLKIEKESILKEATEIVLIEIDKIGELRLKNDALMHNRISYSKSKLLELAENIKKLSLQKAGILETGLLNPIMLRDNNGVLERIHGSNRIKAVKLNGENKIPAIILKNISDELARFMRSSENLNREDLNVYDETLSILEHIQLACNFEDIQSVKSFIIKIKNFQMGKTTLNDNEKLLHTQVSEVFEKIGRFDIITFVDRLSVLKLNPLIKQALVDETISYTQAKTIKSKLHEDIEIKKIIDLLKNKKMSVNELKTYIADLKASKKVEDDTHTVYDDFKNLNKILSKKEYLLLDKEKKNYVNKKLLEIENIYNDIKSILKNLS